MSLDHKLLYHADILRDLHEVWTPHDGQVIIGKSFFYDGKKIVFANCGRKYGKTDIGLYCGNRVAVTFPGSACYYIAPFAKQAREIVWSSGRMQNFFGKYADKYIDRITNDDMRIWFKNGSFFKLDGADNFDAYRGINPHFMWYDEFKDHHPEFHKAMEPNLATHEAPLLITGTPPETTINQYFVLAEEAKREEDSVYVNLPSWTNPHISKTWLDKMKAKLIARGEWDVWMREYEAKFVKGGNKAVFPMLDENKHRIGYSQIVQEIRKSYKNYNFHIVADPGTAKAFAVLFVAYHKYKKIGYRLDEIYATTAADATTKNIHKLIEEKMNEIHPHEESWYRTYDEAGLWFANEMLNEFGEAWMPTQKALNKKENGLSLIKDQLLEDRWYATERCVKLWWEMENYVKDKNGKIPKENDHLIDCDRYGNAAEGYDTKEASEPVRQDPDEMKRFSTMRQDLEQNNNDWIDNLTREFEDD